MVFGTMDNAQVAPTEYPHGTLGMLHRSDPATIPTGIHSWHVPPLLHKHHHEDNSHEQEESAKPSLDRRLIIRSRDAAAVSQPKYESNSAGQEYQHVESLNPQVGFPGQDGNAERRERQGRDRAQSNQKRDIPPDCVDTLDFDSERKLNAAFAAPHLGASGKIVCA